MDQEKLMRRAIALSEEIMRTGRGGPFGAVIARDGKIVAEGSNLVLSLNDPTAHAEMVAIREACRALGSFNLEGCEIFASCEPCPMCMGAIYWAHLDHIYYANTRQDASRIGFDDARIYHELTRNIDDRMVPATRLLAEEALAAFDEWQAKPDKISY